MEEYINKHRSFHWFWPFFIPLLWLVGSYRRHLGKGSVTKSLVFIRAYSYIRVFEEKYSYFTRIFVIYSYFLWFRAHSTRCELFEPVKSYLINLWLQIHGKVLQSWNNKKTCWILNCIGVLWTLNCIGVPIYALLS